MNRHSPRACGLLIMRHCLPALFIAVSAVLVLAAVNMARQEVTLIVDGESKSISTFAHDVAAVLDEAGLVTGEYDYISHLPGARVNTGMTIEIKFAFPITARVDGEERIAWVAKGTVGDLLNRLGIVLGELDRVEPQPGHFLNREDSVRVFRGERRIVTERTSISFREVRRGNRNLDRGDMRVVARGQSGIREDTVEYFYEDGRQVSLTVLHSELIRPAKDRVVEVGENTVLSRGGRSITFDRVFHMTATAYCAGTPETGCPVDENGRSRCTGRYNDGITASGIPAVAGNGSAENPHIVAVDRDLIQLGSMLYIDGFGFALAADTGNAIQGKRIDLLFANHAQAWEFGRRKLRVYLLP